MVYAFADWFGRADSREFVEYWKEYTARHGSQVRDCKTGQLVAWWVGDTFAYRKVTT